MSEHLTESNADRPDFVMPDWMEPYRHYIEADLGGNTTENLLNDRATNDFNNVIRAALICMAETKVVLLKRLHRDGLLLEREGVAHHG